MSNSELVTVNLRGMYRDALRDAAGRVIWESEQKRNMIVADCRRLLAGFMHGAPTSAAGIQELRVGDGLVAWDLPPGPPPPNPAQTALVGPNQFSAPLASLQIDYLELASETVSAIPTSRVRIIATLGPGAPPWPTPTLREFGLIGQLGGNPVLINYVTHPAIVKDPTSTLERTIWLVF